eukprot:g16482.t1
MPNEMDWSGTTSSAGHNRHSALVRRDVAAVLVTMVFLYTRMKSLHREAETAAEHLRRVSAHEQAVARELGGRRRIRHQGQMPTVCKKKKKKLPAP